MNVDSLLEIIKKQPAIRVSLFLVAIVVGIATFFSSLDDVYSLATKYFISEKSAHIRVSSVGLDSEDFSDDWPELSYENQEYVLLLKVNAVFKDERFNAPEYLSSIPLLQIGSPGFPKTIMVQEKKLQSSAQKKSLEWRVLLVFEKQPHASRNISFTLGSLRWDIPVGLQVWHSAEKNKFKSKKNQWYQGQGELELILPNPSWPIVHSARLLETIVSNESVLEIIIENRSEERLLIETIALSASHPKRNPEIACFTADTKQQLMLDWNAIMMGRIGQGAWTKLSGGDIKVPVKYNGIGDCSDFSFLAAIPMNFVIGSKATGLISVNIIELPPPINKSSTSDILQKIQSNVEFVPVGFLSWLNMKIEVNLSKTSQSIFPKVINVNKSINNEMLFDKNNK